MRSFDQESDPFRARHPFSTRWKRISAALELAETGAACPFLYDASDAIRRDHAAITAAVAATDRPIYGLNTLPGHRMGQVLEDDEITRFSEALLKSHLLGGAPFHDAGTARCILAAKLFSLATGGSLCSPELYGHMLETATNTDFAPLIPRHASYSSGDVICGAHMARAIFDFPHPDAYRPKPGEVMSLINGRYVHVGCTLSLVRQLDRTFRNFMSASAMSLSLASGQAAVAQAEKTASDEAARQWLRALHDGIHASADDTAMQPSVSVRATPESATALYRACAAMLDALDSALAAPSNNPLWIADAEGPRPVTQASFVAPSLALSADGVISALLMSAWLCCGRLNFLLSGEPGIPCDGARHPGDISLIQVPKYAWQKLERLRRRHGVRAFASGASTSRCIEDFWTMGTEIANDFGEALAVLDELAAIEWGTGVVLANRFHHAALPCERLHGLMEPLSENEALGLMAENGPFGGGRLLEP